ncbi:KilA-N domain-containing protein [Dyadobacter sp. CY343]|uniref:KilA-N domain-containing protein n=1 Tax=Dyadobacter sp. CY343 TaxID=2907299 RepID=UPI001F1BF9A1|nr:KilA-N domain-containing protein [Dyadobacter sp. CY343]MCE7063251.1 KilA-N domain-containing protein [Dyadobacter sp. CY343]
MNQTSITVNGYDISVMNKAKEEYISLTDIARQKSDLGTGLIISHWLSTKFTVEFIGLWEQMHNPDFNVTEFSNIKNQAGSNGFILSSKQLIEKTGAISIISKPGRYGGGTFAHKDIAFEFASWISPSFKLYLIKEFQRLKEDENERLSLDWQLHRALAKINYGIHTDAIQDILLPKIIDKKQSAMIYANEAELINVALYGITSKEWKKQNPDRNESLRDSSTIVQLVILSNLESINAMLIRQGLSSSERIKHLNAVAIAQMKSLFRMEITKVLKSGSN